MSMNTAKQTDKTIFSHENGQNGQNHLVVKNEYERTDKTILSVRCRANGQTLFVLRSTDRMTSSPEMSALSPKGTTHTKTRLFSGFGQTRFVRRSYLAKNGQIGDFLVRNALYQIQEFCEDNIILSPLTVPNWPFCTLKQLLQVRTTKRDCPIPHDIPRTCTFCPTKTNRPPPIWTSPFFPTPTSKDWTTPTFPAPTLPVTTSSCPNDTITNMGHQRRVHHPTDLVSSPSSSSWTTPLFPCLRTNATKSICLYFVL
jgi:hypothetical protein